MTQAVPDPPWHALPPEVAAVLRPELAEIVDEIIASVRMLPDYARPMDGPFGAGVHAGVEVALSHFLAEIEAQGRVPRADVYHDLGRGEVRSGRPLEALLAAYRAGARTAWRRFAAIGREAGLEPETLYLLAESIFAYIDELSAETAEGYALEQTAVAGEAERRRRRLVRLLVREPPADPATVTDAAQAAGWELPQIVAVVAVADPRRDDILSRLPGGAIGEVVADVGCVVVPDPDGPGRRAAIARLVDSAGVCAGLGPSVGWERAQHSFARARAALALALDGAAGLMVARDHAGELLLRADGELAAEFAADRLAPLATLPPSARVRLRATLDAWIAEQGRLGAVAERLGIHPQTVRYRLGRLRDVFGDALDDPEARFWLELALRLEAAGACGQAPARAAASSIPS